MQLINHRKLQFTKFLKECAPSPKSVLQHLSCKSLSNSYIRGHYFSFICKCSFGNPNTFYPFISVAKEPLPNHVMTNVAVIKANAQLSWYLFCYRRVSSGQIAQTAWTAQMLHNLHTVQLLQGVNFMRWGLLNHLKLNCMLLWLMI